MSDQKLYRNDTESLILRTRNVGLSCPYLEEMHFTENIALRFPSLDCSSRRAYKIQTDELGQKKEAHEWVTGGESSAQ